MLITFIPARAAAPDWPKVQQETLRHFVELLKIDTSNPPGNETKAAGYIQGVLEREGIPVKLLGPDPARLNLVARLKGNGSKRPLLLMGHTDVVGVQREKWTVDPFAGIRKDGFVYGRGTLDDKDNATAALMVMLLLKRMNTPLARDVIFVAESGEEGFFTGGFRYLVEQHWNEIDAEFALAEGGGGMMRDGKPVAVSVAATEKVGRGVTLVARGTAGHGSAPRADNAIAHLAKAVAKIADWQPPMRMSDITRAYFERLAAVSAPEEAARYRNVVNPAKTAVIQEYFRLHEPRHNSILRTSISPNMINGGFRANVIPSEATARLDIRALPDENMETFYAMLRSVINDPQVTFETPAQRSPAPPPSRIDTDMFRALEAAQQEVYPGAVTLPSMLTGATDMQFIRAKGIQSYGVGPLSDAGESRYGAHSDDERIEEAALYKFVEYLWAAVTKVASN